MRHEPALVDAVAGEAAAEMIVDAALAIWVSVSVDRLERIGQSVAEAAAPQQAEELRVAEISARP